MRLLNTSRVRAALVALLVLAGLVWASRGTTPAPAAAPSDIYALFPGSLSGSATAAPGPADALFTTLAGNATISIDVAMYDFNRAAVRDALRAAKGRGVAVRVVADGEDAADPGYAPYYGSLLSDGIAVITDTKSSLMHNKFAVFDQQVTWTGSANFSDTGFKLNGENIVVITDTAVASIYHTEFEEMFGGHFSNDKADNTAHSATVGGTPLEIAFAPTDGVQNRIIAALNSADQSIQVAMFTFTSQPLAQALIAAHQRGVRVEVLLDQTSAGSQFGQRGPLCAAGVTVRVENFAGKIHDKYAVVDVGASDPLVVTGSTNWTANAVGANDENMLIAHDAGLAGAFAAEFARLRSAIAPGGFACNVGSAPGPTAVQYLPIIQQPERPDLVVSSMAISLDTPCLAPTSRLGLRVYVANLGAASAGPFIVDANGAQQSVGGLGAGQSTALWFPGYVAGAPNVATADATGLVAERDETNNQLSQMLPIPTPPLPCPAGPTSTPTVTPSPTQQPADSLRISFILANPADTLSEYVQIENHTGHPTVMTGWTLSDAAGKTYTFPAFTLGDGAEVKIWTNGGTDDASNLYWGLAQAVWNNTGDTAFLRDAHGALVSQYSYP